MQIKVHTLATDDDNGTSSGAFATEDEMYQSLIDGTGSHWNSYTRADVDEWLAEQNDPDLTIHDWWEEHRGDLDSYTCDEVTLDIKLADQTMPNSDTAKVSEALECLLRARQLLKAAKNKRTLERVRSAISSARGARRIQEYRSVRNASA